MPPDYAKLVPERPPNPYTDIVERERKRDALGALRAVSTDPDQAAKAQDLSRRTGVPAEVVGRNLETVEKRDAVNEYTQMLKRDPDLAEALRRPEFAAVAHDDLSTLSRIGQIARRSYHSLQSVYPTMSASLFGVVRFGAETLGSGADVLGRIGLLPENPFVPVEEWAARNQRFHAEVAQLAQYDVNQAGPIERAIYGGLTSVAQQAPSMTASIMTGNPTIAFASIAGQTFGTEYGTARERGIPVGQAGLYAGGQAAWEWATELIPVGRLVGDIKVGTPFYKLLVRQLATEIPGEQVATLVQDLNQWAVLNPDAPFSEYLKERPSAAAQTLIATLVGTALQTGSAHVVSEVAQRYSPDAFRAHQAQREAVRLAELTQAAAESKLRSRAPDTFAQFVQQAADAGEEVTDVYVDAKTYADVLSQSGVDPSESTPSVARQLDEALARGGDLRIPIGEFASRVAGESYAQELLPHLRASQDAMSAAEAETFNQNAAEELKREADKVLAAQDQNDELQQSADKVQNILNEQLAAANRFTPDVNKAYSAMMRDFYVVTSQKLGITPEQMYQRYPLRVTAEQVVNGLEQLPADQFTVDQQDDTYKIDAAGIGYMEVDAGTSRDTQQFDEPVLQIKLTEVQPGHRGEGIGQQLIQKAYELAQSQGARLVSDRAVSALQLRAYEGLRRKGWTIEYADPKAVQEKIDLVNQFEGRPGQSALGVISDSGPVVTKIEPPANYEQSLFHGSPHRFERFSLENIGTGEGAQAYGWGLYFAENPKVAEEYQSALAGDNFVRPNGEIWSPDALQHLNVRAAARRSGGDLEAVRDQAKDLLSRAPDQTRQMLETDIKTLTTLIDSGGVEVTGGSLYEVEISDEAVAKMLDWDAPLSEQPEIAPLLNEAIGLNGETVDYWKQQLSEDLAENGPAGYSEDRLERVVDEVAQYGEYGPEFGSNAYDELREAAPERADEFIDVVERQGLGGIDPQVDTGQQVYRLLAGALSSEQAASERLRDAGIPGIKYFDQGSRDANTGTRNLVVFDDSIITIKSVNGEPVTKTESNQILEQSSLDNTGKPLNDLLGTEGTTGLTELAQGATSVKQSEAPKPVTETAAFKKWFGDSKVVDENGKPLVVYHGTHGNFSEFDITRVEQGIYGEGFYFTNDPGYAAEHAYGSGGSLMPVFLSIKNPAPDSVVEKLLTQQEEHDWSDAELADEFMSLGYDGLVVESGGKEVTYVAFQSEQIKSAIGNSGTFDASSPNILDQQARGQIASQVSQGQGATIALLKNADLSTFLHESGHFFLEVYADLAAQSPEIGQDFQKLLDWFGVESPEQWQGMTLEERRPHHEKFARGFEAYLFEGKAPSSELTPIFSRFRSWLVNVYKTLRQLNVELTPDVRGVMDRMLASETAITSMEAARELSPLFESAEQAGMTDDEWQAYQEATSRAHEEATDQLERRSLRDMRWLSNARGKILKALQREVNDKRKATRAEVADEVAQEPVYQAQRWLSRGEMQTPDGETVNAEKGHKLSLEALEAMYPPGELGVLDWSALRPKYASSTGTQHPDTVADLFGFSSGDHLVRALLEAEPQKDVVEALTDVRMLEKYGDITDPQTIQKAADEAVHNEARARFVATEIRALNRMSTSKARTPAGGSVNVTMKAAKDFIAASIARLKVRDVKPAQYAAAEVRAAKAADKELAAGNTRGAAAQKRSQLINMVGVRAAYDTLGEIEKGLRYLKKFDREGVRKNLDQEYLDQIDQVLERYDLRRNVSAKQAARRKSLAEWVEAQREKGFEPEIDPAVLAEAQRVPYQETTVEQFRGLVDSIKNIEHLGRLKHKLLAATEQRRFDEAVSDAARSIEANATKTIKDKIERTGFLNNVKQGLAELGALHRKLASIVRQMDGSKDGGTLWELFVRPLNEAADKEATMREQATVALGAIFEPIQHKLRADRFKLRGNFVPAINDSLSYEARLVVALNQGNETNRKRIIEGDKWSSSQVDAILDTLDKEDWDFVQSVWDFVDSYWPEIAAQEKRVSGLVPEKVEASPVQTKFGEYKGGYYPIAYDPMRSSRSAADEEAKVVKQTLQGIHTRATTRRGHTKQRVEYVGRPLRKDLGVLTQHVNQVIHDLSFYEYLIDANRLLRSNAIDGAIRAHYGPEILRLMGKTFEDVAKGDVPAQHQFERAVNWLRQGSTIVGLGLNMSTAALQPLGLTQSVVRIGPKWVGKGIAQWLGDAAHMQNTAKAIYAKSEFMRLRGKLLNREIGEIRNRVKPAGVSNLEAGYFYLIQKFQLVADIPTWLGAYQKAIEADNDEKRAVALADQAVIDAQGAGALKDLAEIQRGGPLMKLWTNFYSYFNTLYNLSAESVHRTNFKDPLSVARLAVDFTMLYIVPAALGMILHDTLAGDPPDDPEELVKKLAQEELSYLLGTVVGLRDLGGALKGYDYSGPAGIRAFKDISALVEQVGQGEGDPAFWRALNNTAGDILHYPAGQVDRTARGIKAVIDDHAPLSAVLFGPPKD